jgi:hypothetical protein
MTMDVVMHGDITLSAFNMGDRTIPIIVRHHEQRQPLNHLTTIEQVIEALGGQYTLLKLVEANNKQLWVWKHVNQFPARLHSCMTTALAERGYTASPKLWHQYQPKHTAMDLQ